MSNNQKPTLSDDEIVALIDLVKVFGNTMYRAGEAGSEGDKKAHEILYDDSQTLINRIIKDLLALNASGGK